MSDPKKDSQNNFYMIVTLDDDDVKEILSNYIRQSIPNEYQDIPINFLFKTHKAGANITVKTTIGKKDIVKESQWETIVDLTSTVESIL